MDSRSPIRVLRLRLVFASVNTPLMIVSHTVHRCLGLQPIRQKVRHNIAHSRIIFERGDNLPLGTLPVRPVCVVAS